MPTRQKIRDRIESIREARNLNYTQLAQNMSMKYQKARRFLQNPDPDCGPILQSLARVLHVSTRWLITGEGTPEDGLSFMPLCLLSCLDTIETRMPQLDEDSLMCVRVDCAQAFIPMGSQLFLSHQPSSLSVYTDAQQQGVIAHIDAHDRAHVWGYHPLHQDLTRVGFVQRIEIN